MTEQENLILDGVLRGEPFICVHDGYSYFLGPEAPEMLNWNEVVEWCKSLGDEYELQSKEILNECYQNESIRKEFKPFWYWSSTVDEYYACIHDFKTGLQYNIAQDHTRYVRAVRKIKI